VYYEAGCFVLPTPRPTPTSSFTPSNAPEPSPIGGRFRNFTASFSQPCTYHYWIVPNGVTRISVFLWGAGGQSAHTYYYVPEFLCGAAGAYVEGNVFVTPGETLRINVGGHGVSEECGLSSMVPGTYFPYSDYYSGGFSSVSRLNAFSGGYEYIAVAGAGSASYYSWTMAGPGGGAYPSCELYDTQPSSGGGGGGAGWPGGFYAAIGGASCAPGVIASTLVYIAGQGTVAARRSWLPDSRWGDGGCQPSANEYYSPAVSGFVVIGWGVEPTSQSATLSVTPSPTLTPSRSWSQTPLPTVTATYTPYCHPGVYRTFPRTTLDGAFAADPALLGTERECQRACCDVPGCTAYAFDGGQLLYHPFAACYFLANATQLVPNPGYSAGVRHVDTSNS
jgi:hypothetical protein